MRRNRLHLSILIAVSLIISVAIGTYYLVRQVTQPEKIYLGFRRMGWGTGSTGYWVDVAKQFASRVPSASPGGIWIVGRVEISPPGTCVLSFPSNKTHPHMYFETRDRNEDYLTAFDNDGVKIWLQTEPGFADINLLVDSVLQRYRHHPCILGLGIDLEWHRGWPQTHKIVPVTDEEAQQWLSKIKSYNPDYRLFLKHWLADTMPPTVHQGIVFIDDAQDFDSFDLFLDEFKQCGEHFSQADVGYQVGYRRDSEWWSRLENPPREIGLALVQNVSNCRFVFWTDETVYEVFPPS